MKKTTLFILVVSVLTIGITVTAEDFVTKLPNLLTNPKIIQTEAGTSGIDVYVKPDFKPAKNYTVEVKAKINGTEGRGMDVQALDATGRGFRIVSSESLITDYSNLFSPVALDINDNTSETTLRYVVTDTVLNIYKNNAASPMNPEPIITRPGITSEWDEDFSNGFVNADKWVKNGDIIVTPVTEVVYYKDATTPITAFTDLELMKIETKYTAASMKLTYPVTPGTYRINFKSHAYVQAGDGGLFGVKNLSLRIYNSGTTQQYGGTVWINGHTGNVNSVPRWAPATLEFVVPDTCSSIDISFVRSNPVVVYIDDMELVRISDRSSDILAGTHDSSQKTGIYSDFNLLKDLNPGFQSSIPNDSNAMINNWVTNFHRADSIKYLVVKEKNPSFGALQEGTQVAELFLNRIDSAHYISMKIPANSMKADTKYRLRFSYGCGGGQTWKNFNFYVSSNPDGTGTTIVPLRILGAENNNTLNKVADIRFVCTDPTIDYYMVFMKNKSGNLSVNLDRIMLEEDPSYPLSGLRVGKLFYHGGADIEVSSIKYTDGAYIPGATGLFVAGNNATVVFKEGALNIEGAQHELLQIYSLTGQLLFARTVDGNEIVPVQLAKGVYIVALGNSVSKFIID